MATKYIHITHNITVYSILYKRHTTHLVSRKLQNVSLDLTQVHKRAPWVAELFEQWTTRLAWYLRTPAGGTASLCRRQIPTAGQR